VLVFFEEYNVIQDQICGLGESAVY